jgi:hypothetical protein
MTMSKKLVSLCVVILSTLIIFSAIAPAAFSSNLVSAAAPIVFQDGFESGNTSAWVSDGALSVVTSPVHSGSYAIRAVGSAAYMAKNLGTGYSDLYLAGQVYIPTLPQDGGENFVLAIQDEQYSTIVAGGLSNHKEAHLDTTCQQQLVHCSSNNSSWSLVLMQIDITLLPIAKLGKQFSFQLSPGNH